VGGIRLDVEDELIPSRYGAKFLIHNYGHGGAGITLSFGCASVVVDMIGNLTREMRRSGVRPSVAVIGCGVIGLTVATELRRKWRRWPITMYAKELDVRKTTSFKAGGQFEPSGIWEEYETEQKKEVLADYLRRSKRRVLEIQNSRHRNLYGIALRRDYTLNHRNAGYDDYTPYDVVPPSRTGTLPFSRLNMVGREYKTWLIDPTIFLPQLVADLTRNAVMFRTRQFASKDDFVTLRENIIINCTGYGAGQLMNDTNMIAKRGHLVILRRTLPKHFYFFSGGCQNGGTMYVFCRHSDIVVGGTVQSGNDSEAITDEDQAIFDRILGNARAMFEGNPEACVFA
jgi:glycine/D-amino acid oxidase-like deaminating enzyme